MTDKKEQLRFHTRSILIGTLPMMAVALLFVAGYKATQYVPYTLTDVLLGVAAIFMLVVMAWFLGIVIQEEIEEWR